MEGREAQKAMEQEEEEDIIELEDGEREKEEGYEAAGFEMSEEEEEKRDSDAERDEKESEGKDREKKKESHTLPVAGGPRSTVGHEIGEQSTTSATNLRLRVRAPTEDPRNNTHLCSNGAESPRPHRQRVAPSSRQWLLELTLILLTATLLVMACTRLSREWLDRVCLLSPEKPI